MYIPPRSIEKVKYIKQGIEAGMTLADLAEDLHVTKQRVSQLIQSFLPECKKKNRMLQKEKRTIKSDLELAQRARFTRKKTNSKHTGYEWNISFSDIMWPTFCPILGLELDYFAESRQENSPSFDRTDSSKGYIPGNVTVISWRANRIKNDGTLDEHRRIVEYLENQK